MRRRIILGFLLTLPVLVAAILLVSLLATGLRENRDPEHAAPPRGQFIQTRDAKVFVSQQGPAAGPRVVLIHGTGAWGEIWRDTTEALSNRGFRVLTIDAPPFGFSQKLTGADSYSVAKQADRLLDVLAALQINQTNVVCHSVGCRATVEAILKKPEIAGKLVLVDPALGFADDDHIHPHFEQKNPGAASRAFLASGVLRDAVTGLYGTNPYSIKPLFRSFVSRKESVTDARLAMLQQPLALHGMTAAQGDWLQNLIATPEHGNFTDFASYQTLQLPVLLLWGQDDTITPLWQGQALQTLFSHAQLTMIPNCGHIPYIEQTDSFNSELMEYLSRH